MMVESKSCGYIYILKKNIKPHREKNIILNKIDDVENGKNPLAVFNYLKYRDRIFKFGKTKNIKSRISRYKNDYKEYDFELLKLYKLDNYNGYEDRLNSFKHYIDFDDYFRFNYKSEWFLESQLDDFIEQIENDKIQYNINEITL